MWANLTRLVQQLLAATVLEREEVLGACLVMAGALADQASCCAAPGPAGDEAASTEQPNEARMQAGSSAAEAEEQGAAAGAEASVQLLEFAAELVSHARQQLVVVPADAREAAKEQQHHGDTALAAQVGSIQEQVLMQLARAHLACAQPGRVLDCVATLQGLATGRRPPPGIQQLASLALLQQGQLSTAATQLCLWLQQGGQSTEEACAAVRAFLRALHDAAASSSMPQAAAGGSDSAVTAAAVAVTHSSAAEAVQRVAEAAAERCRSDPGVALVVVQELLSDQGGGCATLDRLAVQLLAIEEVSQLLRQVRLATPARRPLAACSTQTWQLEISPAHRLTSVRPWFFFCRPCVCPCTMMRSAPRTASACTRSCTSRARRTTPRTATPPPSSC